MKSLGRVQLSATLWAVAYQAPLSTGFPRQEYWSGLPFPPPGDPPNQGSNPGLSHCGQTLYHLSHQGSSLMAQTVKHLSTMQEAWVQSLGGKIIWRRKWQSIPVLLPGKSHGCKRVVGYSPWGRKESDTTERLHYSLSPRNTDYAPVLDCH